MSLLFLGFNGWGIKEEKLGLGELGSDFQKNGRMELLGLSYSDILMLRGESEEDLRVMIGHFVEKKGYAG